jgi:transcription antitermination protein NusB
MSTRHIARTLALQTLFELDIQDNLSTTPDAVEGILTRNRDEFGEGIKDISFAKEIVSNGLSRRTTIDDIITRAAPDWPIDKISIVDRNILRIGLTELLFGDRAQVPPKVAIDEAIELAKSYGGETSGRFVNGVLGAIYKEMGEPEKAQVTKTKKDHLEGGKREVLSGAVVVSSHEHKLYVALVHDVFGYWTLPKGHIGESEDETVGVVREIKREIGLEISVIEKLGENEYIANKPEIGKVVKHVSYYLATSHYTDLHLEKIGGLDEVKWFPAKEVTSLRMYDDIKPLVLKALESVDSRNLFA